MGEGVQVGGRVRARPGAVARRDRAAAAAGGHAARGGAVACNLVVGLAPVGFVVATSVVVGRLPGAVQDGWDSPDGRGARLGDRGRRRLPRDPAGRRRPCSACSASGSRAGSTGSSATGSRRRRSAADDRRARGSGAARPPERGRRRTSSSTRSRPGRAVSGLVALINRYVPVLACDACSIGVVFSWLAALAIFVGSMLIRYGTRRGLVVENGMWRANMTNLRESWYFRGLALEPPAGKELRIYGLVPWAQGRHRAALRALVGHALAAPPPALHDADGRGTRPSAPCSRPPRSSRSATRPRTASVSLRDTAFVLQAGVIVVRVGAFFMEGDLGTEFGMSAYQALSAFEEKAATRYAAVGSGSRSADGPAARVDPLRGRVVRVPGLGAAGAGRARPRDPGRRVARDRRPERRRQDDADQAARAALRADRRAASPSTASTSASSTSASWRSRIAAIFQDFVRYELPAADNIGLGSVAHLGDEPAILRAAQRAGALEVIEALPDGLATPLSARYTGGVDVSGGQWQRIALSRALFALEQGHVGARARRADRQPRRARRGRAVRPLHRDHGRRDDDPHLAPLLDRAPCRPDRRARRRRDRRAGKRTTSSSPPAAATPSSSGCRRRASRSTTRTAGRGMRRWVDFVRYLVGVSLRIDRRRTYVLARPRARDGARRCRCSRSGRRRSSTPRRRATRPGRCCSARSSACLWIVERRDRPPRPAGRVRARRPQRDRVRRGADRARRRLGGPRAPREPGVREPARARPLRGRRSLPRDALPRQPRRASCCSCS